MDDASQPTDIRLTSWQLQRLLDSAAEGIYGVDTRGNCTFANAACVRLLRYGSAEELLGRNMHALIHPRHADGTECPGDQCAIGRAYQQGDQVHVENEVFFRSDGTSFPVEYWSYPIWGERGIEGAVVSFVDISDRVEANRERAAQAAQLERRLAESDDVLRETRDRLALALEYGNIGLWDWNTVTNQVYYSSTTKTQLGYPPDAPWSDFSDWESRLHPDDHDEAVARVQAYLTNPQVGYHTIFRLRCLDGSYRWIQSQGKAQFDAAQRPLRMIGVHVDITEHVELEERLQRANSQLQESIAALSRKNEELNQFAYLASHDLQAPLRSIVGFAELMLDESAAAADGTAREYLDRIIRSAKRMRALIEDLLQLSRLESKQLEWQEVEVSQIVHELLQERAAELQQIGATVDVGPLPVVSGDPRQLRQLFQNLIDNAIKYRDLNRPLEIRIHGEESPSEYRIAVVDNGLGIDEEYHEEIFKIFRRLHVHGDRPGTGIGLAICRKIVDRHGGKILVRSNNGSGTEFTIVLPKPPSTCATVA
ncbi:MAG: hypothetical protein KatS3mg111_2458 [Pirellulaceae bacterium]|nr:MAG: hypothetical protein KatS3mg111_2458 [Pirellulaceae bacterium]